MNAQAAEQQTSVLSLYPPRQNDPLKEPLETQVPRISVQYNGFHHVSDQELSQGTLQEDVGSEDEDEAEDGAEEDQKGTLRNILKRKREMTMQMGTALQELLLVVDTMSLLDANPNTKSASRGSNISSSQIDANTKTERGKNSMSPFLRDSRIKPGSLDYEKAEYRPDPVMAREGRLLNLGITMESLTGSASSLLAAAGRLEEDAKRETEYWGHVLSVSENDWPVYRLPQATQKMLAVQYGALEAGTLFRSRGVAPLRPNSDGSIKVDLGGGSKSQSLRVRIKRGHAMIAETRAPVITKSNNSADQLEADIRMARDSLLEEELFHEIAMEARSLYGVGVRNRSGAIHVPLIDGDHNERIQEEAEEILIDLVPMEEELPDEQLHEQSSLLADGLALALRLLLLHTFRQRHHQRTSMPPPLSEAKKPTPPRLFLKPLIANLRHHAAVEQLRFYLDKLSKSFSVIGTSLAIDTESHGGLEDIISTVPASEEAQSMQSREPGQVTSSIRDLIEKLLNPPVAVVELSMQRPNRTGSTNTKITITVKTHFGTTLDPYFAVDYQLQLPADAQQTSAATLPSPPTSVTGENSQATAPVSAEQDYDFTQLEQLKDTMGWYLAVYLAHEVLLPALQAEAAAEREWRAVPERPELRATMPKYKYKDDIHVEVEIQGEGVLVYKAWVREALAEEVVNWSTGSTTDQRDLDSVVADLQAWVNQL